MDVTTIVESDYIGVAQVKESPTKKAVVLDQGSIEPSKDGLYKQLQVRIQIDGKIKLYKMNRTTAKNLSAAWGRDTNTWVGKIINLTTMMVQGGREAIIGTPNQ